MTAKKNITTLIKKCLLHFFPLLFINHSYAEESVTSISPNAPADQDKALERSLNNIHYANIEEFISSKTDSNHSIVSIARGDLNGDSLPDYAVTIGPKNSVQVIILMSTENKKLRIFEESTESDLDDLTIETSISKNHLHIKLSPPKGGQTEYLFATSSTQIILTNMITTYASGGSDDEPLLVYHTYFNSITGEFSYSHTNGRKEPFIKEIVKNPECYFHDFDFDLFFCAKNKVTAKGENLDDLMTP